MVAAADLASIALEKHLLSERLEFQALHDALTGLPNRSLFADRLAHALTQAERHRKRVALLYVDLDGFKPINDQYGHSVGDALLREIATRLVHCVRTSDTVARLGGDEFCVILGDLETTEQAVPVALKIVQTVGSIARLGEREVRVDSSVGLAVYPDHAEDAGTLYRLSDQAMYRAKNAGGHRVAIHAREDVLEP
jgi:diguanylate cyclase (GGDEF)-like protein